MTITSYASTTINTDTTNFDNILSSADTTTQKALETIDEFPAYGSIYAVSNTAATIVLTVGTAVLIEVFTDNGASRNMTPDQANNYITINRDGDYMVNVQASVNSETGPASRFEMTVRTDAGATILPGLHCDRNISGGGGATGSVGLGCITPLSAGDNVTVWIENETNTANYIIENISLSIVQIGG